MTREITYNNVDIDSLSKSEYTLSEIEAIESLLIEQGVFDFEIYPDTGLFPATHASDGVNNYNSVWLRDTIHIANALYSSGMTEVAANAVESLVDFHIKHLDRWQSIVNDPSLAIESMNRPHVRFDGTNLTEIDEKWSHAQNDAIGYLLWVIVKVFDSLPQPVDGKYLTMLQVIPIYLNAIEFWKDADSGHWEEAKKVEASSIGCCIAGLEALVGLVEDSDVVREIMTPEIVQLIHSMIATGREVLDNMLPSESIASKNHKGRAVDSALLFLCYPLKVVSELQKSQIRKNVQNQLQGAHGIRRYVGDSFWTKNYPELMAESDLTRDFSEDILARDQLASEGAEAQWCIFDSIISVTFGSDFLKSKDSIDRQQQTHYFNRAIGQITGNDCRFGPFQIPEAYYLQDGVYIPNDATPLQWAKANLIHAFRWMKRTH